MSAETARSASLRSHLRRRLEFTREGKYFFGITVGVGFAAINTGNNLLYLVLGMLLSLIIASGILSEVALGRLQVSRQTPLHLFAERPFLMGITLDNHKQRLPSFSIEIEDLVDDRPLDKKCYFLKLPAGRTQRTSYRHLISHRGCYRFTGFRVSTKFPFALFRKSVRIADPMEVVVFPALHPVKILPAPPGQLGEEPLGRRGQLGEFFGLRDFRQGDDPRDIHFRASARSGRTLVREYEDESTRRVALFVDNGLPDGSTDADTLQGLERAISEAASLGVAYLEAGYQLLVVTRGQKLGWLRSPAEAASLLQLLALLPTKGCDEPFSLPPLPESLLVTRKGVSHRGFGQVVEV